MSVEIVHYSNNTKDNPPENLIAYIAWLQEQLATIPTEYRSTAKFWAIETHYDPLEYQITYNRPADLAEELAVQQARKNVRDIQQARWAAEHD